MSGAPWDDCKVAFSYDAYDGADDPIWSPEVLWPLGWTLDSIDPAGARCVAIFRVAGVPLVADGERVREFLDEISHRS